MMPAVYLSLMLVPLSVAAAILRYRLWDIDLIINRTLVYVPLTAILAGSVSAAESVSQEVFVALTGDRSDTAIVIATLVVVSAFDPVKNAIQGLVDRHFREPASAVREVRQLNDELTSVLRVLDAGQVTRLLAERASVAYGVECARVYLRQKGRLRLVHAFGGDTDRWVTVPLTHEGRHLGLLALGPRRQGGGFAPADLEALNQAGRLVAQAIVAGGQPVPLRKRAVRGPGRARVVSLPARRPHKSTRAA
jgi:hypothetical protein